MKWITAALLALIATMGHAQEKDSSLLDCGLKFGSGEGEVSQKYQPHKFRSDYQDTRPAPFQTLPESDDFSLQVKSDNGERRLMDVFTVARFECSLD